MTDGRTTNGAPFTDYWCRRRERAGQSRLLVGPVSIVLALVLAGSANAATPDLDKCLDLTGRSAILINSRVADNLGLTRDVEIQLRARLSTYGRARGFAGLDGIGLTPEQIVEVERRIAVQVKANTWPLGWPCKPFANPRLVKQFVRTALANSGYYAIRLTVSKPRQVQFVASADGVQWIASAVRSGPRQIAVKLLTSDAGRSFRFNVQFAP